jgi:hypothetical protein
MSVQLHIHTPDDECTETPLAISSSGEPSTAVFTVYWHQNCVLADKSVSWLRAQCLFTLLYIYQPSQELHNVALTIANLIIQNKNHLLMLTNQ